MNTTGQVQSPLAPSQRPRAHSPWPITRVRSPFESPDCVTLSSVTPPPPVVEDALTASQPPSPDRNPLLVGLALAGAIGVAVLAAVLPGNAATTPVPSTCVSSGTVLPGSAAARPGPSISPSSMDPLTATPGTAPASSPASSPAARVGSVSAAVPSTSATPPGQAAGGPVQVAVSTKAHVTAAPKESLTTVTTVNLVQQPLKKGLQGEPIRRFQEALARYAPVKASGVFDEQTDAAVRKFQGANGLGVDGVVGNQTYGVLWSRSFWEKGVALDLNGPEFYKSLPARMRLQADLASQRVSIVNVDNNQVVRSYPISSGAKGYSTPRGKFTITSVMEKPTWYPPRSSWAAGAKVTPPGPTNPLGPAALELSHSSILFHGVPRNEWGSIGRYPESHGCMRMFPQDAWELHKIIKSGTPVEVK